MQKQLTNMMKSMKVELITDFCFKFESNSTHLIGRNRLLTSILTKDMKFNIRYVMKRNMTFFS